MNDVTLPTTPDESDTQRAGFSMAPAAVLSDPALSDLAVRVYLWLDYRAGSSGVCRTLYRTVAADLGKSESTVKRAVAQLRKSGWVRVKRTGKSSMFYPLNPSRITQPKPTKAKKRRDISGPTASDLVPRSVRSDLSEVSDLAQLQNKKVLTTHMAPTAPTAPAATTAPPGVGGDPMGDRTAEFTTALPEHLRPNHTNQLAALLDQTTQQGWSPEALARRIEADLGGGTYSPGAVIARLRALANEPPPPPKPQRPAWCGDCDESTRLIEQEQDGRPVAGYCPTCHPKSKESAA